MAGEVVHPAIRQAVWSAVGSIPGCALVHVSFADASDAGATVRSATVGITGWSPSLHSVEHEWLVPMDMHEDGREDPRNRPATTLVRRLRPRLAEQRRRSAAGLALGEATPYSTQDGRPALAHLECDASLLGLVVEDAVEGGYAPDTAVRRAMASALSSTHTQAMDHRGGPVLDGTRCLVAERDGGRVIEVEHTIRDRGPVTISMRGSRLVIAGMRLPETIVTGARGIRLGRLASIHALLDDRTIAGVETTDAGVAIIGLEPITTRIGDVTRLGAAEALDLITARCASRDGG